MLINQLIHHKGLILSGNSLHFVGIRVFIVVCIRNAKSQFSSNRTFWRLNLATGTSRKSESRANCLARPEVLSCNASAVVTLQLPCMLHTCAILATYQSRASCEIQLRDSFELHTSWVFFTLSHTLHLHKSHLNTWYLIVKLQANLARNKANTWLNKFNLTIPPLGYSVTKP